jgi:hypothetical protein
MPNSRNSARRHKGSHRQMARTPTIGRRTFPLGNPRSEPAAAIEHWKGKVDGPLFVYFVQSGEGGPVKIGKANNPLKRIMELQCGNPVPLLLQAVVLASIDLEESLHLRWSAANIGGEWFAGGLQDQLVERAREAMAGQIDAGHDLYYVSSTFVKGIIGHGNLSEAA